ncbi:MAG: STAS domain-containing protein [Terriglobales bacterium]
MMYEGSVSEGILQLKGDLDIRCSAELKGLLIEAIAQGKAVRIELAQVAEIDVTAVQLLWAAKRYAEKTSVAFAVAGDLPDKIRGAVGAAGFENFLVPTAADAGQPSQ